MNDWIAGEPITDIEAHYSANAYSRVGHGDIRGYADGSRFILESALRIAAILLGRAEDEEATALLFTRLDHGLPAEALPLLAGPFTLTRGEALALYRAGHRSFDAISTLGEQALTAIVGRRGSKLLALLNP